MATTQRLLDYLMVAPPWLPTEETNKTSNTTNDEYGWRQNNSIGQWSESTYAHIMQLYGTLLQQVQTSNEPTLTSPPQPMNTELMFAVRFTTYVPSRLHRALRSSFQHLAPQLANLHLTPITVDIGDASQIINKFQPDTAFSRAGRTLNSSPQSLSRRPKGVMEMGI